MKKITFLLSLMISSLGFSQQVLIENFETPASYTYAGFEGLGSASIVADPVMGGTNINGLRLVSASTGNPWQGAEVVLQNSKIKLTTDKTVKIDVYATQAFNMLAKVELGGTAPNSATAQSYSTPGVWQTLTFTFNQSLDGTGIANGEYSKIVFFPNWNGNFGTPAANFTVHLDNITAEQAVALPDPTPSTAAPTPPARAAADVKSIFSNAYSPIAVLNYAGADGQPSNDNTYNTSWCGANTSLVQVVGNDTNKIVGLGCEGIAFFGGRFSAAGFTHFHMDIWTSTPTQDKSFNFKFSNWSGGTAETNAYEYSANNSNILPSTNPGTWISIDIPITSFTAINAPNNTDFTQFVITSDLGTVYYDNLYLHKNTVLSNSTFETSKVSLSPNPTSDNFTITAISEIQSVSVYNLLGQEVMSKTPNTESVTINISDFQAGIYLVKTTVDGTTSSSRVIKK
jgi:hypothetical protein